MGKTIDTMIRGIDERAIKRLDNLAREVGMSRNALIVSLLNSFDGQSVDLSTAMASRLEQLQAELEAEIDKRAMEAKDYIAVRLSTLRK